MRTPLMLGVTLLLAAPTVFAQSTPSEGNTFLMVILLTVVIPCGAVFIALLPILRLIEEENRSRTESRGGGFIE